MNQPSFSIPDKPHTSTPFKAPKPLKRHNVHPVRADRLYHDDFWNIDLKADRQLAAAHNPLVSAAVELLAEIARLRDRKKQPNIDRLHARMEKAVRRFTRRGLRAGLDTEVLGTARYLLCTAVDEVVMTHTEWPDSFSWSTRSLLVIFHGNNTGGSQFFECLELCLKQPFKYLWLLELMYLCLALGFEGKFAIRGTTEELHALHNRTFIAIQQIRGEVSLAVCPDPLPKVERPELEIRLIPGRVLAVATLIPLSALLMIFTMGLNDQRHMALEYFTAPHSSSVSSTSPMEVSR